MGICSLEDHIYLERNQRLYPKEEKKAKPFPELYDPY